MPTYVALIQWTDEGVRNAKETANRAQQAGQLIERLGGKMTVYWTQGRYDIVALLEAPDDETATTAMLATSSQGNVRTETMRAFTAEEMQRILQKMP